MIFLDYNIPERSARPRPFVFSIASYLVGFLLLMLTGALLLMSGLMLAYSINTSVMFLVTLFWKISVHAAGVTGPLTFLVFRLAVRVYATESFLWLMPRFNQIWNEPQLKSWMVKILDRIELELALKGLGDHLLGVGRR